MSNRVSFQYTKFTNYNADGTPSWDSWGYRIYDDYDQSYNNTYDSLEELMSSINRGNVAEYIANTFEDFWEAILHSGGLYFCNDWITTGE
jgi:hypothetical protein